VASSCQRTGPNRIARALPWADTWDLKSKKATLIFQTSAAAGGRPNTQHGVVNFHRGGFFTRLLLGFGVVGLGSAFGGHLV